MYDIQVAANSVYGTLGKILPAPEIGASVCAMGREALQLTRTIMEEDGYTIVYGDTDSVFCKLDDGKERTLAELFDMGRKQAAKVTAQFDKPMNLEFEKVFSRLLLLNKKKYTGLKYSSEHQKEPEHDDTGCIKMDQYPFAIRNFCRYRELVLGKGGDDGTKQYIQEFKEEIQNLIANTSINYLDFAQTKKWSGKDMVQGQAVVAKKMKERGATVQPGDPITYVTTYMPKIKNMGPKAEDVHYASEHKIPLDLKHYLQALEKNVLKIAEVLHPSTAAVSKIKVTITNGIRHYENKFGRNQSTITDTYKRRELQTNEEPSHKRSCPDVKVVSMKNQESRPDRIQTIRPTSMGSAFRHAMKEEASTNLKAISANNQASTATSQNTNATTMGYTLGNSVEMLANHFKKLAQEGHQGGINYCKKNNIKY